MKLLVVNNLSSGLGDATIYDFIRAFSEDGDQVTLRSTDGTTPIRSLLADASDYDAVVASGGDGTVTAVSFALAGTNIPVLPFPAGTANLLSMNLGMPSEPHALADMVRNDRRLQFDLGRITYDGGQAGFGIIAGAGYDAAIMKGASPNKKTLGAMAYAQAALTNPLPQRAHFTLDLDGQTIESDGIGVLVINFAKIQFDIPLAHGSNPRDGLFEVGILKAQNAFELIPALFAGILDREGEFPDRTDCMEVYTARTVRVTADPPMNIQFDGEATEVQTPFTASILPDAVTFIVSEESYAHFTDEEASPKPASEGTTS